MSAGYPILLGERWARYLTPSDLVPEDEPLPVGYDRLEDLVLRRHPRFRRVLTTLVRPTPLYYGLLHWGDGTDLATIDDAVVHGGREAAGLASALLVEVRTINCRHCRAALRVAVPDAGNPLATTAGLQAHAFVRDCPVCGHPFGQLVAEIIGEVPTDT